jgi:hypothetical protein
MDATLSIGEGPCYGAGPREGRIPPAPQAGTHPSSGCIDLRGKLSLPPPPTRDARRSRPRSPSVEIRGAEIPLRRRNAFPPPTPIPSLLGSLPLPSPAAQRWKRHRRSWHVTLREPQEESWKMADTDRNSRRNGGKSKNRRHIWPRRQQRWVIWASRGGKEGRPFISSQLLPPTEADRSLEAGETSRRSVGRQRGGKRPVQGRFQSARWAAAWPRRCHNCWRSLPSPRRTSP